MMKARARMKAETMSQTVLPLKAVKTCLKVIAPETAQATSAIRATVPSSIGCRMKPTTVPRKIENRYQALGVSPSGMGMNQPEAATTIVSSARHQMPCFGALDIISTPLKTYDTICMIYLYHTGSGL